MTAHYQNIIVPNGIHKHNDVHLLIII